MNPGDQKPGVLLSDGSYYGTLSAARAFHRAGFHVALADEDRFCFGAWSQSVDQWVKAPRSLDIIRYKDWLLEVGPRFKGFLIYPTSDDLCWIISRFRDELKEYYRVYYPDNSCIMNLLDKSRLYLHAKESGLDTIPSWTPNNLTELEGLGSNLSQSLIYKPRTQIGLQTKVKGLISHRSAKAVSIWQRYINEVVYHKSLVSEEPDIIKPLIQKFLPEAKLQTYSVAGFLDQSGKYFFTRASNKVYQFPPTIGVGISFKSEAVINQLKDGLQKLLKKLGYYGVFEAEFVQKVDSSGNMRYLLMDLNPRFYGQMGFEIARLLPLPDLLNWDSLGDVEKIAAAHKEDSIWDHEQLLYYHHFSFFKFLLFTQWVGGQISKTERRRWLERLETNRMDGFDFIASSQDKKPLILFWWRTIINMLRHPRSSIKQLFF